jgi:hypothetical protein
MNHVPTKFNKAGKSSSTHSVGEERYRGLTLHLEGHWGSGCSILKIFAFSDGMAVWRYAGGILPWVFLRGFFSSIGETGVGHSFDEFSWR